MNFSDSMRLAALQRGRGCALVGWLLAGSCLTAAPALAQTPAPTAGAAGVAAAAQEPALQEVVVTARKKAELLQNVPVAVTALTAKTIERANLQTFTDVAKFTPSFFNQTVVSGRQDRFTNVFVVRGLNLSTFTGSGNPVLLFVDGAPVISGDLAGFDDIERIEVLRGPQSAYFGRNTFAGAINVVTKDPSFDVGGRVRAEWANHDTSAITAEVEGPIVADKLAFRLGGRYRDEGGMYKNPDGGTLGARKTKAVSLTLLAKPTDDLRIKAFAEYARNKDGPAATGRLDSAQLPCVQPGQNWICGNVGDFPSDLIGANADIYPEFRGVMNKLTVFDHPFIDSGGLAKRTYSAHLLMDYNLPGGMSLSSTTAYHKSQVETVSDEDARDTRSIPNPFFGQVPNVQPFYNRLFFVERYFKDLSQEVRLTSNPDQRLRWAAGVNYVHVRGMDSNVVGELGAFVGLFTNTGVTTVSTPSVFGAAYFDLTKSLTASLEAREQWDRLSVNPGGGVTLTKTFASFSPRVTLQYRPDDTTNIFVDWARGYRPGNFNARLLTLPASDVAKIVALTGASVAVDQEQLDEAELGVKKRLFDNRASLSLVGYYGVLKNQQVQNIANFVDALGRQLAVGVIANIGKTEFWGVEFEGAMAVTPDLTVNATWSWNESKIKKYVCIQCAAITGTTNVAGNRLPGVPKYTASLYATYTRPLKGDYDWFVRPEYVYSGSSYATEANLASTGARNEVNIRAGVQSPTIRFEGYVTNLFNDKTPISVSRATDSFSFKSAIAVGLPPLREVGVRATYNF